MECQVTIHLGGGKGGGTKIFTSCDFSPHASVASKQASPHATAYSHSWPDDAPPSNLPTQGKPLFSPICSHLMLGCIKAVLSGGLERGGLLITQHRLSIGAAMLSSDHEYHARLSIPQHSHRIRAQHCSSGGAPHASYMHPMRQPHHPTA